MTRSEVAKHALVDDYLAGKLNTSEAAEFEQQMHTDSSFAELVEMHKFANGVVKDYGLLQVKMKLQKIHLKHEAKPAKSWAKAAAVTASVAAISISAFLLMDSEKEYVKDVPLEVAAMQSQLLTHPKQYSSTTAKASFTATKAEKASEKAAEDPSKSQVASPKRDAQAVSVEPSASAKSTSVPTEPTPDLAAASAIAPQSVAPKAVLAASSAPAESPAAAAKPSPIATPPPADNQPKADVAPQPEADRCAEVRLSVSIQPEILTPSCEDQRNGEIQLTNEQVFGGEAPYEFSLDGGQHFQTDTRFVALEGNRDYELVIRDVNGCTSDVERIYLDTRNCVASFNPIMGEQWEIPLPRNANGTFKVMSQKGMVYQARVTAGYPNTWNGNTVSGTATTGEYVWEFVFDNGRQPLRGRVSVIR